MKKIIKIFVALLVFLGVGYVIITNLPQSNIRSKQADDTISAIELFNAFESDETSAVANYQNKVLRVKGTIGDAYQDESGAPVIIFEDDQGSEIVLATLEQSEARAVEEYKVGNQIEIKALCTGKIVEVILSKGLIEE